MTEVTRKVSTDALETLGTIIGPNEKRDAIHLAVLPVMAGARLYPGQEINVKDGIATAAVGGLGIVDPFIQGAVMPEQRFWMVLKPRLVTSLRHVWSHPAFEDEAGTHAPSSPPIDAKDVAMAAIQSIAGDCGMTADDLIEGANAHLDHGDYISTGSFERDLPAEFWSHFETVTGRSVGEDKRYSFFLCSC